MDFLESLQNNLKCAFKCTMVHQGVYLMEQEDGDLGIFYYVGGAKRVFNNQSTRSKTIHIDEDLWKSKPQALMNRLSAISENAERSYARETVVARVDKKMAITFQEEHHLQGALAGKYRYGLFKNGELLAVAVFSGLRNMRHTENYRSIELLHYCQKDRHLVIGGLSKLIAFMARDLSPNDVMTYIDKDWSTGEKFESLGFKIISHTEPQSFQIDKNTYQRQAIKEKKMASIDENQYLVENCGSIKMIKTLS